MNIDSYITELSVRKCPQERRDVIAPRIVKAVLLRAKQYALTMVSAGGKLSWQILEVLIELELKKRVPGIKPELARKIARVIIKHVKKSFFKQ